MANRYLIASQKAELAVKADTEGRLAEAMRYYEEASEQLVEYCKEDQSKYTQMSPHIQRYIERASEIQRELLKQPNSNLPSSHTSQVDAAAQRQLEDMGLTSSQARDALIRFDNDVNRSITWFLENSVEEDLPSQPAQRPTSLPPANTSFQPTNPPKPTYSQKPSPPVAPTYQLLPATNPSLAKAPALPIRPPIPSPPAETQSVPQSTKSVNLTATTSSTSTGAESDALIGILRSAMVSTTDRCRCVMFTVDRGDICGMPAALVGDADGTATDVAGDLCWSCKYMEAISGIDATLATSEDEDEAEERQDQAVASNADAAADAAEIAKAEASREVEIPVPAPAPAEEPKGWFSGWLSGGKSVKESDISNGALTKNDREALEGEFVALKGLKQHGVMSDTQKARFRLVRRSLRTNEALVTPLGVEAVTSSPRRGSSQAIVSGSSGSRSSGGSKVETESAKVARLKKLLRDAKVSDVPIICSCSMYSVVPGEVCGRPVALAVDPETNIATPTKMCWQCKRIEAYGM